MTKDNEIKADAEVLRRAIEYLELAWWVQLSEAVKRFAITYQSYLFAAGAALAWVLLCLGIYIVRPLTFLRLNEVLRPLDVTLPSWLGGGKVPLRAITLIGLFGKRRRTLDAWIRRNLPEARKQFEKIPTVYDRRVHIDLPVTIDGVTSPSFAPSDLNATFARSSAYLLITGEGGSGKTSLAAELGRRAMQSDDTGRLAKHLMIPVWIEDDLSNPTDPKNSALLETVRRNIQLLVNATELPAAELVTELLIHRRILLIADRFSELNDRTRDHINPSKPDFLPNCVVVTSRWKEDFGNVDITRIEPLRVAGNQLSSFMEAYLMRRQKRGLFTDSEFFAACGRLTEMVQGRTITILFAKLFAEEVIRAKEAGGDSTDIRSLPQLVARYLNHLNDSISENKLETGAVHRCAKLAAWKCVEDDLRPSEVPLNKLIEAFGEDGKAKLDYLEKRLRLIKYVEPEFETVRFSLDPLAEYLAASYVVEQGRSDAAILQITLRRLKETPDLSKCQGFIRALYWYFKDAVEDQQIAAPFLDEIAMIRQKIDPPAQPQ
jgi:hypothetical protein